MDPLSITATGLRILGSAKSLYDSFTGNKNSNKYSIDPDSGARLDGTPPPSAPPPSSARQVASTPNKPKSGFASSAGKVWDFTKDVFNTVKGPLTDIAGRYVDNQLIGLPNAQTAYNQSKEGSTTAWNRSYGAYKRRYQDTMADMKKAGLNPMLAAGSGFTVSGQPNAPAAKGYQAQSTTFSPSQSKKNIAETQRSRAITKLTTNQAATELKKAIKITKENRVITQQEAETIERTSLLMEQNAKTNAEWKLTNAKRQQVVLLNQRLRLLMKKLGKQGGVYNNTYGTILTYIREILGSIGALIQGVPVQLLKP